MSESVYKVIEVVGTSTESWEQATTTAMMAAARSLRDIRVAEVVGMDVHLDGEKLIFRAKIKVSFKYHDE